MTTALQKALDQAKHLPAAQQDTLADVMTEAIRKLSESVASWSEAAFTQDWDNELDAAYDNWQV
jgi:hypothetical protein